MSHTSSRPITLIAALGLAISGAMVAAPAQAAPTCAGRAATIVGTSGEDSLRGTSGTDVVWLGGGDDRYYDYSDSTAVDYVCMGAGNDYAYSGSPLYAWGEDGNDRMSSDRQAVLYGGAGDDSLKGGSAYDRLYGMTGEDQFTYTGGRDILDGGTGPSDLNTDTAAGVRIRIDLPDGRVAYGGRDAPLRGVFTVFRAGPGVETYIGRDVRELYLWLDRGDRLYAGGGDDDLHSAGPVSRVEAGDGDDAIHLDPGGAPVVLLGAGNDYLTSYGKPTVYGQGGNDHFRVKEAGGRLDGGSGVDELDFQDLSEGIRLDLKEGSGSGPQGAFAALNFEDVDGTRYADVIKGTDGANHLQGGRAADTIYGRGGPDVLVGYYGADKLYGGAGRDHLYGGPGTDIGYGGPGADKCWTDVETRRSCQVG